MAPEQAQQQSEVQGDPQAVKQSKQISTTIQRFSQGLYRLLNPLSAGVLGDMYYGSLKGEIAMLRELVEEHDLQSSEALRLLELRERASEWANGTFNCLETTTDGVIAGTGVKVIPTLPNSVPGGTALLQYLGSWKVEFEVIGNPLLLRNGIWITGEYLSDGEHNGSMATRCNHSCQPNAILLRLRRQIYNRVGVFVVSLRPIHAAEEVTVSYFGGTLPDAPWTRLPISFAGSQWNIDRYVEKPIFDQRTGTELCRCGHCDNVYI